MEHEFHHWLKQLPQNESPEIRIGIGDDAAVLSRSDYDSVITTDTIAEGTHFDLSVHSLELVGRKSLAVNLSDIAAMGAEPTSAVLNFMLPRTFGFDEAKLLFDGIQNLASEFNVAIIGGDTNTWNGPLVVGATVIGKRKPTETGWTIDGAKNGDALFVSGSFGGSIHQRHLSFQPRVELARYLSENYQINGATDASDSLSLDLSTMLKQSGLGVSISRNNIPVSPDVTETDFDKRLHHALSDGEDFELILAVPTSDVDRLTSDANLPTPLTMLGNFTNQHQDIRDEDGSTITPKGYEH